MAAESALCISSSTQSRAGIPSMRRSSTRVITARRATPGVARKPAVMKGMSENIACSRGWPRKFREVAHNTSPLTSDRCRCHSNCAIGPPIEYPTAVSCGMRRTSASAATSSAQSARRKWRVRMPCPWPRWSIAITRYRDDNGSKHHSQLRPPVADRPCSNTTVGAPGGPDASRMNVVPRPGSSTNRPAGTKDGGATNVASRIWTHPSKPTISTLSTLAAGVS